MIALKFDKPLDSCVADVCVKFHSDGMIQITNLAALRFNEILW